MAQLIAKCRLTGHYMFMGLDLTADDVANPPGGVLAQVLPVLLLRPHLVQEGRQAPRRPPAIAPRHPAGGIAPHTTNIAIPWSRQHTPRASLPLVGRGPSQVAFAASAATPECLAVDHDHIAETRSPSDRAVALFSRGSGKSENHAANRPIGISRKIGGVRSEFNSRANATTYKSSHAFPLRFHGRVDEAAELGEAPSVGVGVGIGGCGTSMVTNFDPTPARFVILGTSVDKRERVMSAFRSK